MKKMSYVLATDPAVDLAISEEMAHELEAYIIGDDLYRLILVSTPTGEQRLQMTGGDLLARLYRLQAQRDKLTSAQQGRLDRVKEQAEKMIYSLRTRFHQRLEREVKSRLDALKWFLDECPEDMQRCRVEFPFEMRNRQRIQEILKETENKLSDELADQLKQIDHRIRMTTATSRFIWDEQLEPIFPRGPYWYLYVRP